MEVNGGQDGIQFALGYCFEPSREGILKFFHRVHTAGYGGCLFWIRSLRSQTLGRLMRRCFQGHLIQLRIDPDNRRMELQSPDRDKLGSGVC